MAGCDDGAAVGRVVIHRTGHVVPGGEPTPTPGVPGPESARGAALVDLALANSRHDE
ncbi:MAG: hypothetical protein JWR30_2023 [Conexibacter sp.]|nr:hypothetical protein [Conexibacter sp.]